MSAALKHCKINDKFQDPLFLFLELIRGGVLHGKLWSHRAYSGGPSFGEGMCISVHMRYIMAHEFFFEDDEKRSMLLIMRVLSIVPLQFKVCYVLGTFIKDYSFLARIASTMERSALARATRLQWFRSSVIPISAHPG